MALSVLCIRDVTNGFIADAGYAAAAPGRAPALTEDDRRTTVGEVDRLHDGGKYRTASGFAERRTLINRRSGYIQLRKQQRSKRSEAEATVKTA
jgi:hypothetical protein